jgi:1,4-alpha-glucan branching enzyme
MNNRATLSFVLNGHTPFIRHPEQLNPSQELWFFQSLSETYIPLLEVFDRLDRDLIPFRITFSLSPILCHMLTDEYLLQRYLDYTQRQIIFGVQELERARFEPELEARIKVFYDRILEKRALFSERYECNILRGFEYYQKKGRIEIISTAATHAFLPFYTAYPEAIQAQLETAIFIYKANFGKYPQGFWLPELGWKMELDSWLREYNISYTIVEPHALIYAQPKAKKGSFYPVRTPQGTIILGRDFYASEEIGELSRDPSFRYNGRDQGFELPPEMLEPFLGFQGSRTSTGFKYWAAGDDGSGTAPYDPEKAREAAEHKAVLFLENRLLKLKTAEELMDEAVLSLCAFEADRFGRFWHEGPEFLESLFREGAKSDSVQFLTPAEYLCKQDSASFQTLAPEFSSWGTNGYAETCLDGSNDWIYRHAMKALERMVELVERFPNSSGLKERVLNQAAREILLVLSSDWPRMLYKQESADYARSRVEGFLRNFTTIYEALGSNYISTERLTNFEKRNNIFPNLNYRVFRRKSPVT